MNEIILVCKIRDKISGLEGIAVAKVEYLNGNIQFAIQPKCNDGLKVPDTQYVNMINLEYLDEGVFIDKAKKIIGFKNLPQ